METDLNFFEEVGQREIPAGNKTAKVYPRNFKKGILIGGASIALILGIVGFQSNSNAYSYEDLALHLDSIQIQQNDRIIQLLETRTIRDTTIVHIIAPTL